MAEPRVDATVDCIGLYCPVPIMKTRQEMDKLTIGQVMELLSDDAAVEEDIKAWAKRTGQRILDLRKTDEGWRILIKKVT